MEGLSLETRMRRVIFGFQSLVVLISAVEKHKEIKNT